MVVVEEEDTTRELRRLESTLSGLMKQIKVSTASRVLVRWRSEFFIVIVHL